MGGMRSGKVTLPYKDGMQSGESTDLNVPDSPHDLSASIPPICPLSSVRVPGVMLVEMCD